MGFHRPWPTLERASFLLLSFHQTIEPLLLSHIKLLLVVQHLVEEVGLLEALPLEESNKVLLEFGDKLVRLGLLLRYQLHPVHLVQPSQLPQQLLHLAVDAQLVHI